MGAWTLGRFARWIASILSLAILLGALYGYYQYRLFFSPPKTRLQSGDFYPGSPPDEHLHYLDLPLDHGDLRSGTFVGFYRLGPNVAPGKPIVFCLADAQQPMVGPEGNHESLDDRIRELPWITIGQRGVSPALFPEVYTPTGALDHRKALHLYSSTQQVEDVECVRRAARPHREGGDRGDRHASIRPARGQGLHGVTLPLMLVNDRWTPRNLPRTINTSRTSMPLPTSPRWSEPSR